MAWNEVLTCGASESGQSGFYQSASQTVVRFTPVRPAPCAGGPDPLHSLFDLWLRRTVTGFRRNPDVNLTAAARKRLHTKRGRREPRTACGFAARILPLRVRPPHASQRA